MTEIQQQTMSRESAERLTERIRMVATTFMETRDKLSTLIHEAQEGRAHEALGFRSWTEYIAAVCSETPLMRLSRDERRVIVSDLAEQGMSTRAIAPVVGANQATVVRDLGARDANASPAEAPAEPSFDPTPSWDPVDTETGEIHTEPRSITGMDGKTYTRPEPKEETEPIRPRRRPIGDAARDAGWEVRKATERIEKLLADDRYPQNKEQVTTHLRGHLLYVVESCQGLLDQLD